MLLGVLAVHRRFALLQDPGPAWVAFWTNAQRASATSSTKRKRCAKKLRTLLASYERKQKEVQEQADRIVEAARKDAALAADQAKEDLKASIARRLAAAQDQLASAEAGAVKEVRDTAVTVAIAAANDVIAKQMTAKNGAALIDDAIGEVSSKLH